MYSAYQNINKMGTQFLHLSCQGGGLHPGTFVSHTIVLDLCCILELFGDN